MTALLAKACALALAKHPVVNACCKDGKSFTYNEDINVAVAVAMDGGLLTPVLKNADKVLDFVSNHFLRNFEVLCFLSTITSLNGVLKVLETRSWTGLLE